MLSKETFTKLVKDALTHLYDPIYLQNHPLSETLVATNSTNHGIRAQMLRETIVEAIEQLQPDRRLPFGSKEWVTYRILNHRYLEAMSPKEVADKLHISERHFFRQHHKAVEAVTAILWDRYVRMQERQNASRDRALSGDTVEALNETKLADFAAKQMVEHSRRQWIDLIQIISGLQQILQPLGRKKGVNPQWEIPAGPLLLYMDPAVLRQIILNVILGMLKHGEPASMRIGVRGREDQVLIEIECSGVGTIDHATLESGSFLIARHLTENEGGNIRFSERGKRTTRAVISLAAKAATILMIEDNPDAITLFRRYLAGSNYRLVGVLDVGKVIPLAETLKPNVIILDVMMPSQDGWQVLQALRTNAATAETPVIVCSVLDQPELAFAMGADDLIQKPVSQQTLLDVLERWIHRPRSQETSK